MRSRSLRTFIRDHREQIDAYIRARVGDDARIDDSEREMWIRNDESLYNDARRWGWRG